MESAARYYSQVSSYISTPEPVFRRILDRKRCRQAGTRRRGITTGCVGAVDTADVSSRARCSVKEEPRHCAILVRRLACGRAGRGIGRIQLLRNHFSKTRVGRVEIENRGGCVQEEVVTQDIGVEIAQGCGCFGLKRELEDDIGGEIEYGWLVCGKTAGIVQGGNCAHGGWR